jgi:hypothetical protein
LKDHPDIERAITEDEGLIMFVDGGINEVWSFLIQEGILTITSRQVNGMEFNYI